MKYKIVAHLISPDLQDEKTRTAEYEKEFSKYCDVRNIEEFEKKYPIDSNVVEEFDSIVDYILEADADGIYLFKKIN